MRRLPGPAGHRLGDEGNSRGSLRIVSGLAENTNSIFCDGSSEPGVANGCPVERRSLYSFAQAAIVPCSVQPNPVFERQVLFLKSSCAFPIPKVGFDHATVVGLSPPLLV